MKNFMVFSGIDENAPVFHKIFQDRIMIKTDYHILY